MSDGKGKIIDGMSYQSTLPEEYAKVKHQRDKVVKAFNILKERQREVEGMLAELELAARNVEFYTHYLGENKDTKLKQAWVELSDLI